MTSFLHTGQKLVLPRLKEQLDLPSQYFKVELLLDGGMGTCAKIEDDFGHKFALKTIHTDLLSIDKSSKRYLEEISTWLTVSSCDGVVNALCLEIINKVPCVISEWMEGGSLTNLIGTISPFHFYHAMDRICTSLQYVCETYGYIHRDLKPANILLNAKGEAFIGDWGLAKDLTKVYDPLTPDHSSISPELTSDGNFIGTILYAAPEQILGRKDIDFRADIYSIGCIMYQWETGKVPFYGKSIQEIASAVLYTAPKKLGGLFTVSHYKVGKIIDKCLEKDPDKRYQSYAELLADIEKVASSYSNFTKFHVTKRKEVPKIGNDEFDELFITPNSILKKGQKGIIVELDTVSKYLDEASYLIGIGKSSEGCKILKHFFIRDMFENIPDDPFVQLITINLAYGLSHMGKDKEALDVISILDKANNKSLLYYVNASSINLNLGNYQTSLDLAKAGLYLQVDDTALIGNATQAAASLGLLDEARDYANCRLGLERTVESLSEAGYVYYKFAESKKNNDFPTAINAYKKAYALYTEALTLNPQYLVALLNQSLLLFKMKRYEESMRVLKSIESNAGEIEGFYFARACWWYGDCVTAKKVCESWLKPYPNSLLLNRLYNEILVDDYILNNTKDGCKIWIPSVYDFFKDIVNDTTNRRHSDFDYLAKLLIWGDNIDEAINTLSNGIEIFPDSWLLYFRVANIFFRYTKDVEAAIIYMQKARELAPWRETTYKMLSEMYKQAGDYKKYDEFITKYGEIMEIKKELYNNVPKLK